MSETNGEMSTPTESSLSKEATATLKALERFDEELIEETGMWVFGYGSLVWLQGFAFEKRLTGFVKGFSRKFWQGNTAHRGTVEKPGRVATLIEEEDGIVWGEAFQVKEKDGFSLLHNRECELGGYITTITTFYPRPDPAEEKRAKPFPAILYIATSSNSLWLGDAPLSHIAHQIVECSGNSGHNVEYLLKLASFIHENVPEAFDDHLFTLERLVLSEIQERNLCLKTLMGEKKPVAMRGEQDFGQQDEIRIESWGKSTNGHVSTVPSKKLRCVDI